MPESKPPFSLSPFGLYLIVVLVHALHSAEKEVQSDSFQSSHTPPGML